MPETQLYAAVRRAGATLPELARVLHAASFANTALPDGAVRPGSASIGYLDVSPHCEIAAS